MQCPNCNKRMRLKLDNIGQPVIVGPDVYSADKYTCECGFSKFGTPGQEPICKLADWNPKARLKPVPLALEG